MNCLQRYCLLSSWLSLNMKFQVWWFISAVFLTVIIWRLMSGDLSLLSFWLSLSMRFQVCWLISGLLLTVIIWGFKSDDLSLLSSWLSQYEVSSLWWFIFAVFLTVTEYEISSLVTDLCFAPECHWIWGFMSADLSLLCSWLSSYEVSSLMTYLCSLPDCLHVQRWQGQLPGRHRLWHGCFIHHISTINR